MPSANTTSLQTDFNVHPYYDDFNETKNFHRVLFIPTRAVQARELTQSQTILQNQIDRMAEHFFKDGSLVNGGEFRIMPKTPLIKIKDADIFSNPINMANLAGATLTGATTGVEAKVIHVLDGAEGGTNTKTIYIAYTKANESIKEFSVTENIVSSTGITFNMINSPSSFGFGYLFEITEGILFSHDHFIRFDKQLIVIDRYGITPTCKVGFDIVESIVTSNDDASLLDPANGSFNYGAPGANRLRINAVLRKYLPNEAPEGFSTLFDVQDGVIISKKDKPDYAKIREEFARRTFDESGHYTVEGLGLNIKEHLNTGTNNGAFLAGDGGSSQKLAVGVEPGKAYVGGYEHENLVTRYIPVDKGTATKIVEQQPISTNYGNYILVKELTGFVNTNTLPTVEIYNAPRTRITSLAGSTLSPVGTLIGTASVRAIVWDSGSPGHPDCRYRVYVHDVKMTAGAFETARSIFINNPGSEADFGADIVLEGGNSYLKETAYHVAIFPLTTKFTKTIRGAGNDIDTSLTYAHAYNVSIGTNGQFTVDTGSDFEVYNTIGTLNATQKLTNFILSVNSTVDTANLGGTVSTTLGSPTVSGSGTAFLSNFSAGEKIKIGSNVYIVNSVTDNTTLTIIGTAAATVSGQTYNKRFIPGDIIDLSVQGRVVNVQTSRFAAFDISETLTSSASATLIATITRIDAREKRKLLRKNRYVVIDTATHPNTNVGPWSLGISDIIRVTEIRSHSSNFTTGSEGSDVTGNFIIDDGNRDYAYNNGVLSRKGGVSVAANSKILVKLDHFDHDTSQGYGYFSIDSYPIDDNLGETATTIRTESIPVFTSPSSGRSYDLRDCIDFRPAKTNAATSATTPSGATVNPGTSSTFINSSGIVYYPAPNYNFVADITFYLARKDLVVLDIEGNYKIISGVSDVTPITPAEPENAMVLATLSITPYPSLAPGVAGSVNRPDLAIKYKMADNQRSTMRDVRVMKRRIENLEYYTSLSLLERETADIKVLDENGLDRFKNGIIVDSFTGHNVADVYNPDFSAAIDRSRQELRPRANIEALKIRADKNNSSNIQMNHLLARLWVANPANYVANEEVYQGSPSNKTASAYIRSKGQNILHVEYVSGTFIAGQNLIGATSGMSSNLLNFELSPDSKTITLPYSHSPWINQPLASTTRNAAGLFWAWKGEVRLDPAVDTWTDTYTVPDLRVNQNGNMDAWNALANAWGTDWGSWQTVWSGTSLVDSRTTDRTWSTVNFNGAGGVDTFVSSETTNVFQTTNNEMRTGTRLNISSSTESYNLGTRVIDTSVVPYMRSIYVKVAAYGMKPGARLYAFFDGTNVTSYVTPTDSSYNGIGAEGSSLLVDSSGNFYGYFRIPNSNALRFPVGTKVFRLCDSPTNSGSDTVTAAEARFTSSGLVQTQQNTILSTQVPNVSATTVAESRTTTGLTTSTTSSTRLVSSTFVPPAQTQFTQAEGGGGGPADPMGQSFTINTNNPYVTGVFATKIDLYFRTKHPTLGVTVEIREMENGIPTNKVVPFSSVTLNSYQVAVSEDSSAVTTVWFDAPVFLKNSTDYFVCIKPVGSNPDYNVWTSRLGESDILTGQRIVQQPNSGVIFASANATTWTPVQEEDLKYTLYVANFVTNTTGNLVITNDDMQFVNLVNITASFNRGQEPVNITSDAGGSTIIGTGYIYEYPGGFGPMSLIMTSGTAGVLSYIQGLYSGGRAQIDSFLNKKMNIINVESASLIFNFTDIAWTMRSKDLNGNLGEYAPFNMSNDTVFNNAARLVQSKVNESGTKSLWINAAMKTSHTLLSPLVDITRFNSLMIENLINDDASGELSPRGGTAQARYMCRPVTLKDGQDAEDLMVMLSVYRPPSTDVKVYVKLLHGEDSDIFGEKAWIEMSRLEDFDRLYSDKENFDDYKEFIYNIPDAMKTGPNGAIQYINSSGVTFTGYKYYAIKIVLLGANSSIVPKVKDMRGVCLQA